MPAPARKDTLAAFVEPDFQHGRFEPGQRLGSRYRMVALLGEGGMGEVYRADDLELGQSVALKFLPERVAADESWLRRFRNEVRTARQIAHPNVCRIYDIGEQDGHVFLSMEYVDGEDLAGVLRRLGRPSREKAIEIARQICLGLAAAHENGVLHRDLKPANIMIDGRGRVRITDFGLAGFLDELEGREARAGTPAYMAPEQLTDGKVSVRSDIYALGLVLHELFTGQSVFDTDDMEEIKRRQSSGSVTRPSSSTGESIDPAVERVISRSLEELAEDRPQSVYQVLASLPGGDPLAAALAAGETPSPEMVANARGRGGLRPTAAVGLLIVVLASLAGRYWLDAPMRVHPERSPQELSFVVRQMMEELGYAELPKISVSGYMLTAQLSRAMPNRTRIELAELEWPPKYRYWMRWSRGGFQPISFHRPERFTVNGAVNDPEHTATISVDSAGRLRGLVVGSKLGDAGTLASGEPDWSGLFRLAGLVEADCVAVEPVRRPLVHCDVLGAWRIDAWTDGNDEPVTLQLGMAGGRPNYFELIGTDTAGATASGFGRLFWLLLIVGVPLTGALLAWRNLRNSRGDRCNALRCAVVVGVLYCMFELLAAKDLASLEELTFGRAGGHIVLHAAIAWLSYMAIEPYVRRVWPRMLVGLVRLLGGRWRDPAVGREALIGIAVVLAMELIVQLLLASTYRFEGDTPGMLTPQETLSAVMSPGAYLADRVRASAWAVAVTLLVAGLLVLLRLLTRHNLAAVLVVVIGFAVLGALGQSEWFAMWQRVAVGALIGGTIVMLYTRIGLVSAFVASFMSLGRGGALGSDLDSWLTPYGVAELAFPVAISLYGFWVSLAGQPIFRDTLAEPKVAA